jgi:tetratricopeptide (TPR) repeat protein
MLALLKATQALDSNELINWTARILLDAQHQGKPNKGILVQVAQAFDSAEEYESAIVACRLAQQITPNDPKLVEDIKELSAKAAIKKGGYEQEGDFTKAVKDMDRQKELAREDALVKGEDFLRRQVDQAREEYLQSPKVAGKINVLIDALLKTGDPGDEGEAIDVLAKAHKDLGAYQFKMRIDEIKIRQMTNRYRKLVESGDRAPAIEEAKRQLEFELQVYTDRAANYPTDLGIKFELGKRQFLSGKYDEAIGSLQQAQRDPRRRIEALNYLGQAFGKKGWNQEAAETFERALESDVSESRKKDIWYNLGDIYEKAGRLDKADAMFSDLAQTDYNYRDVRERLDKVRKERKSGDAQ